MPTLHKNTIKQHMVKCSFLLYLPNGESGAGLGLCRENGYVSLIHAKTQCRLANSSIDGCRDNISPFSNKSQGLHLMAGPGCSLAYERGDTHWRQYRTRQLDHVGVKTDY